MGIHNKTKMKLFIIAAVLIASVLADSDSEAEAKPWLAYSNYGAYGAYPSTYATYAHGAYPYAGVYGAGVYGAGYNGYALGGVHHFGKRSADSDAEAKPWLAYGYNGYNGYLGARYAGYARPYSYGYASPYTYGYAYGK